MPSLFRIAIAFASRFERSYCVRGVACLIAIITVLPFSAVASHDFAAHFRLPVLAPVVARHTFASPVHDQPRPRRLIAFHFEPMPPRLIPRLALHDHFENGGATPVSIVNRFCRLKLGPHRDCDAEPIA
jgi:hypothetical protein